ncbi:hypothetical protein [Aquimonas voraii]|uniref:Uncharacterized protein n=1 Tax=Aquimonas voraii TaxID=265719 RepID=A0A1G7AI03_9GAMM|nr:hypothetical protein [Aquimonas voraii]SDE14564.1 hypothetical protein SAMN04488509_1287 [Aquimonas voraii]
MRPHYLTVIPGGLRRGETVRSKLISRPFDFPDEVFQRLYLEAESTLPLTKVVELLKLRKRVLKERRMAEAPDGLQASELGYEEIPLFLLSPEAEGEAPSKP